MSIVGKVYNRILLDRLRMKLDVKLRYNQNGFRQGRGTVEHILALRRIVEGIDVKGGSAVLTFIDFKKAFDCENRGRMMKILKAYGASDEVIKQILAHLFVLMMALQTSSIFLLEFCKAIHLLLFSLL